MPRAEFVLDVTIVLGTLVDILDHQADRRAGGDLFALFIAEHAGENAHRVRFAPLGGEARLAGPAFVKPDLDIGLFERQVRWTAIYDTADGGPVGLAKGGHAKQVSEGVVRHGDQTRLYGSEVLVVRCGAVKPRLS